jgi:hypothetical protein
MTDGQKRAVTMVAQQYKQTEDIGQLIEDLDQIFCKEED